MEDTATETPLPPVNETEKSANAPAEDANNINEEIQPEKVKSRYTKGVVFSPAEFAALDAICEARCKSGITTDWNHFIRQLMDFALNSHKLKQATFAVPSGAEVVFKNAFINPINK